MHQNLKILHYIGTFSHLVETFVYDLITNLNRTNSVEHFVLCHQRINERSRPFASLQAVPFDFTLLGRIKRRVSGQRFTGKQIAQIAGVLETEKPDLIHAHFGINGVYAMEFLNILRCNIPMIVHCHGTDVLSFPYTNLEYKEKLIALSQRSNTLFIVNTQFLKEAIVSIGIPKTKIGIVRNSVNPALFMRKKESGSVPPALANGPLRIIAVGRMIRWKGQRYLLEGLASFLKNYPGKATLTLIGEGDEREPLENLCRNLGLGNAVNFRGAVKHAEVAQALQKHDLLIQPSIVDPETRQCESFGMTILEAIASGLPVAVSRSGGMPELVGSESSWSRIFKPASAQAIADVIEACYIEKPHLSSNADYAKERLNFFSWENQEASLTDAYRAVMTT